MRSVIAYGVLAAVGLGLAFWAWTQPVEEETGDEAVTLVDCEPEQLRALVLDGESKRIEMTRREEGGEAYYWFRVDRRPAKAPAKTPSKQAEAERRREQFVGGSAAAEYSAKALPLRALRSLGEVPRDQLDELGLDRPATKLQVQCGGRTRRFDIGASTFGASTRYAREGGRGPVYLLDGPIVADLEAAEFRLMQRDLHRFELTEVDEAVLHAQGQDLRMLHRNRRDPQNAEWVNAEEPDRRNETYGNWLDRLSRLRILSYLAPNAQPGSDLPAAQRAQPTRIFTLEHVQNRRELDRLELVRVGTEYYAKTNSTRTWVKVLASVARQLEDDLPPLLGMESTPPTDSTPTPPAPPSPTPTPPPAPTPPPTPTRPPTPPRSPTTPHDGHDHGGLPPGHP